MSCLPPLYQRTSVYNKIEICSSAASGYASCAIHYSHLRRAASPSAIEGAQQQSAAAGFVLPNSGPVAGTTTTTAPPAPLLGVGGDSASNTTDDAVDHVEIQCQVR